MKKKIIILLSAITIVVTASSMSGGGGIVLSSGAPVGSTNAPGENSCGKSGCHTGVNNINNINTGIGKLSISSAQDIANYNPGKTYDITVSLEENGIDRFGFALTVLDATNNKVGSLMVTDQVRTQIFQGVLQYADREYMTYRMVGTNPYVTGKGQWTFQWKAPDKYVGNITFYAAGISANNDATDKGDLVYTTTYVSTDKTLGLSTVENSLNSFKVFPNPATNNINISLNKDVEESLLVTITGIDGKVVMSYPVVVYNTKSTIAVPVHQLSAGTYFLNIRSKSLNGTSRIILTK